MSNASDCANGVGISGVWAIIVSVFLLMIIYGYVSSKLGDRRRKKVRSRTLPFVDDTICPGVQYKVVLNDGREFESVELMGTSSVEEGHYSFAGPESMLILKQVSGKRVFLKQSSVRFIEEI